MGEEGKGGKGREGKGREGGIWDEPPENKSCLYGLVCLYITAIH
jgi:hypothetical protein